jgi:hypothetical protein
LETSLKGALTLVMIGSLIVLFTFPYPPVQPSGEVGSFYYFENRNIGKISKLGQNPASIHVERPLTLLWIVEVYEIPPTGIRIILGAEVTTWRMHSPIIRRQWSTILYPKYIDKLPLKMSTSLPLFLNSGELNTSTSGAIPGTLKLYSSMELIDEWKYNETIEGGGSSTSRIFITNDNILSNFCYRNLFGIGLGFILIGLIITTISYAVNKRLPEDR